MPPLKAMKSLPEIVSLGRMIFDPIWAKKAHMSGSCELIHVIRGHVVVVMNGARLAAAPGDTVLVPAGTRHRDEFDLATGLEVFMVFFTWKAARDYFKAVPPAAALRLPSPARREIRRLFQHLQANLNTGSDDDRLVIQAQVLTILLMMLRAARQRKAETGTRSPSAGERRRLWLIQQAKQYLETHYRESISLEQIARALRVSAFHLSHVFSGESDFTLFDYLTQFRMKRAMELLEQGELNVAEVAYAVGFNDSNHFSKVFRHHFGFPPRQLRGLKAPAHVGRRAIKHR